MQTFWRQIVSQLNEIVDIRKYNIVFLQLKKIMPLYLGD
jgi:hypothetical protein